MPKSAGRKKKSKLLSSTFLDWVKAFVIALLVLVLFRVFIFDLKSVSHNGMEATLLRGDIMLVNKYNYGSRMPMRILPQSWVNLFFSTDTLPPVRHLPYWRFPGNRPPQHGDLVMINVPAPHSRAIDQRTLAIRRLGGLPGDSIELRNGLVYVNGMQADQPEGLQWNYLIEARSEEVIEQLLDEFNISEARRVRGRSRLVISLPEYLVDSLGQHPDVRRIIRSEASREEGFASPFGEDASLWDSDNFGPLFLPYKGMVISLDSTSIDAFGYLLTYHERIKLQLQGQTVLINGKPATEYRFRNNYFFFLGDNRHNTSDSRLWGAVPENHVIGRASLIFLSIDRDASLFNKFRWQRFFRSVNVPD